VRHRVFAATFLTRCAFPPDTEFCLGSFIVRLFLYPALPGLRPETERRFRSDSGCSPVLLISETQYECAEEIGGNCRVGLVTDS